MRKLYEILGRAKALPGDFGIEIEVEGNNLAGKIDRWWKVEHDGSLRGESCEYVLKKPIKADEVPLALKYLNECLENSKLDFSFRTSVHVHVNVQELTHIQIMNMIYTYFLLEEPLMTYCGKSRKGNRFCLRLQDAEGILDTLLPIFKGDENSLMDINEDSIRYSAINLAAIRKFGSLEFRAMEGNMDIKRITEWTRALGAIREYAINMKSPKEIQEKYQNGGTKGFLQNVLGNVAESFYYPRLDRDMQQSFSLSLDLPYAYSRYAYKELVANKKSYAEILKVLEAGVVGHQWLVEPPPPAAPVRARRGVLIPHE